jgi:TPR repeat protein
LELIKTRSINKNRLKEAFILLKNLVDNHDPEAAWRVAACFHNGWGIEQSEEKSLSYSKIAMKCSIPDAYFWSSMAVKDPKKKFHFIKEGAN